MAAKALLLGRQAAPGWWVSVCGWVCCGEGQCTEGIPPQAPLFTLVIFDFHEGKQHNIDDVCVEFC